MEVATLSMVGVGCLGGMLPDVIRLIKGRHNDLPGYLKTLNFWLGFILLVALGGFAAWLIPATDVKQAIAYGYSAPEIISRLVSAKTETQDRRAIAKQRGASIFRWWTT